MNTQPEPTTFSQSKGFAVTGSRCRLIVCEHPDWGYKPRTVANASEADLTVAFAVDFGSAGERLTKQAAGRRYTSARFGHDPVQVGTLLGREMQRLTVKTLNVAGNSAKKFYEAGYSQAQCNEWVHRVLSVAFAIHRPERVISGGQTGVDMAGVISAWVQGIDCVARLPLRYTQRLKSGKDVKQNPLALIRAITEHYAKLLQPELDQVA